MFGWGMTMSLFQKVAAISFSMLLAGVANATTVYTFNATEVGAFGAGPYGTVTLEQTGGDVNVRVDLRSDLNFVTTGGPHSTFSFMVDDAEAADVTNILFSGSSNANYTVVAPGQNEPYGMFTLAVDCTGSGCSNGAGGQIVDPLTFTVLNAVEADFANQLSSKGAYFAADVICISGSCNGATGAIGVVPLPGAIGLFGIALAGLGVARRNKK